MVFECRKKNHIVQPFINRLISSYIKKIYSRWS